MKKVIQPQGLMWLKIHDLPVLSADHLCNQFVDRSGPKVIFFHVQLN